MKSFRKSTLTAAGATLAMFTMLSACGDDDDVIDTPAPGSASIRVVHGSPDAPAVDIYAEGVATPLITGLEYGDTSDYLVVDEGAYNFQIRAAGAAANSMPAFETGALALAAGAKITALATGLLGSSAAQDRFRVLPLAEGFSSPGAGNAIVRIVHASADAPTVAIDVGNDGSAEVASLARFADTGMSGIELPAGVGIQVGIWSGDTRVTAFTTPELPAGAELFVIASGLLGKLPREMDGFSLLAISSGGTIGFIEQNPTVYALHASPDAPSVDVLAGDALLVENLSFGELSAPVQVPPGSYNLDFYATGTRDSAAASAMTPSLAAGERYLAVASGFLAAGVSSEPFQLLPLADMLELGDVDNARVAVLHASPDAPGVDISTVTDGMLDTPVLVSELAFTETTEGGLSIPPTTLTLGVAAAGSTSPVATFGLTTTAGLRAIAVASGALSPGDGAESFRLLLVVTSSSPWQVAEVLPN